MLKILLNTKGVPESTDLVRIIHLFYPDAEVQRSPANEMAGDGVSERIVYDLTLYIEETDNLDRITAQVCTDCKVIVTNEYQVGLDDTVSMRQKIRKRAALYALHEALHQLTGRALPWGYLTGVRPTKLIHKRLRQSDRPSPIDQQNWLQSEFLISPRRAALMVEVAQTELRAVPDLYHLDQQVSLYVGIPFCPTHCAYCTFPAYSMAEKGKYAVDFLRVLVMEIKRVGEILREYGVSVTTVYVGGGTPTSLKADELEIVLDALRIWIPSVPDWREFCIEAGRADTITRDRLAVMRAYGVDRISVNPQSFRAATLKKIGRGHTPDIVDARFALCREAGFTNINMDLILGLPGETIEDVQYSLDRTLQLHPDSVTIHTLSYKRNSAVGLDREAYEIPDDDVVFSMMQDADGEVRKAGLLPYYLYRQKDILANLENIGYSHVGKEGIYNIAMIEEVQTIVGLGGGGASKWVKPHDAIMTRHQNPREPLVYVNTWEAVFAKKEQALREVCEAIVLAREIG